MVPGNQKQIEKVPLTLFSIRMQNCGRPFRAACCSSQPPPRVPPPSPNCPQSTSPGLGLGFGGLPRRFSKQVSPWKVGIYGLALNPKRQKFGWPPANRQVGGKKRSCSNSWSNQSKVTPNAIYTYHMPPPPHPLGVKVAPSSHKMIAGRD